MTSTKEVVPPSVASPVLWVSALLGEVKAKGSEGCLISSSIRQFKINGNHE